jgi:hypothetical protein
VDEELEKELESRRKILSDLMEKAIAEKNVDKYYDEIVQCCIDLAKASIKPLSEALNEKFLIIEKTKTEAVIKQNVDLLTYICGVETALSWLKGILNEIMVNRALILATLSILPIKWGVPVSDSLAQLWQKVLTLEEQKTIELKIPENIEKELKEWMREREEMKRRMERYIG